MCFIRTEKKTENLIILGYYGNSNLGDELILREIIKKNSEYGENITILSSNPELTSEKTKVQSIHKMDIWNILKTMRLKNTKFLFGGGSLLQDDTSVKSLIYYLFVIFLAFLHGNYIEIYRNGIGNINSRIGKFFVPRILNLADVISVRDSISKKNLEKMGVKKEIHLSVDPVLEMDIPETKNCMEYLAIHSRLALDPERDIFLGVSFRRKNQDVFFKKHLIDLSIKLYEEHGIRMVIIPFHYKEDFMYIPNGFYPENCPLINITTQYSDEEFLDILSGMDIMIGERLHSIITSYRMNIPFLSISYDIKIDAFLDSIDKTANFMSNQELDLDVLYREFQEEYLKCKRQK